MTSAPSPGSQAGAQQPTLCSGPLLPFLPPLPRGLAGRCLAGCPGPGLPFIHTRYSPGLVRRAWALSPRVVGSAMPGFWVYGPSSHPTHLLFQSGQCSPSIQCLFSREHTLMGSTDGVTPPSPAHVHGISSQAETFCGCTYLPPQPRAPGGVPWPAG